MARTQIDSELILDKTIRQIDLADELTNGSLPIDYIATTEKIKELNHYVVMTEIVIVGELIIEGTLGVL